MAFTTHLFDVTGVDFTGEIKQIERKPGITRLVSADEISKFPLWLGEFSRHGIKLSNDLVVTRQPHNICRSDIYGTKQQYPSYGTKQQIFSPTEDDNKNLANWRFTDEESQRGFIVVETDGNRFEVFESTGIALVLSGGAPQSTLAAGTLCALIDCGVEFDAIFTSGAGVLMGLLLVAPKGASPKEALTNTIEMGVSDEIHDRFPFGYKTFFKPGPFSRRYKQWGDFYKCPPYLSSASKSRL